MSSLLHTRRRLTPSRVGSWFLSGRGVGRGEVGQGRTGRSDDEGTKDVGVVQVRQGLLTSLFPLVPRSTGRYWWVFYFISDVYFSLGVIEISLPHANE